MLKYRKRDGKEFITMGKIRHPGETQFYEAVLSLTTIEECQMFFEDISTIKELQAMSQRLRVAALQPAGQPITKRSSGFS